MSADTRPLVIAMKGLPGSGKSTLARGIGRRIGVIVIDKDEAMESLDASSSGQGREAYRRALEDLERCLVAGESVIIDSPLAFPSLYESVCRIARSAEARAIVVECVCSDEEELRRRIERRANDALPPHRITGWPDLLAYRDRTSHLSGYPIDAPHIIVDTTRSPADLVESVLRWLDAVYGRSQLSDIRRET